MRKAVPADQIRRFFESRARHAIVFAGFGELGYQDPGVVDRVVREVLAPWRADEVIVVSGTLRRVDGHDGIAEVYAIGRQLGFETAGIHPSIALDFAETHTISPFCDHVFFVGDDSWGGFSGGRRTPSPTLGVVLDVADELVVIGGGKHAADEIEAFLDRGKPVRYFAADMNHQATENWCRRSGARISDYRGAAYGVWSFREKGKP
jgi:hypothetical protein